MTNTGKTNKNIGIEIYRILFTTIIMLHHFRMYSPVLPFGGGYMATDFFFIVAGVFVYRKYLAQKDCDAPALEKIWDFTKKRYARLFIPLIICNVMMLAITKFLIEYILPLGLFGFVKESLMIEVVVCNSSNRFNTPTWYLGVLLVASVIVYVTLVIGTKINRNRRLIYTVTVLCILSVYVLVMWGKQSGNIYIANKSVLDVSSLLRGISGTVLGAWLAGMAEICVNNKGKARGEKQEKTLFVVKTVFFIIDFAAFVYLLMWCDGYSRFDIVIYVLIILTVWMLLDYRILMDKYIILERFISIVGKSAYIAYLIHYPIARILMNRQSFGNLNWKIYSLVFILFVWIIALVVQTIFDVVGMKMNEKHA